MLKYIIQMLILTGARKREVTEARWADFDVTRRVWRIPTTKRGIPRHVPISDGVMSLLAEVPRMPGVDHVFANPATRKPYISLFRTWNRARQEADLADVRIDS